MLRFSQSSNHQLSIEVGGRVVSPLNIIKLGHPWIAIKESALKGLRQILKLKTNFINRAFTTESVVHFACDSVGIADAVPARPMPVRFMQRSWLAQRNGMVRMAAQRNRGSTKNTALARGDRI